MGRSNPIDRFNRLEQRDKMLLIEVIDFFENSRSIEEINQVLFQISI